MMPGSTPGQALDDNHGGDAMANVRCHSCAAPIFWVRTKNDKMMPLDAVAVVGGNIEIIDEVAHVVRPDGTKRFTSHFSTCPHAKQHRRN